MIPFEDEYEEREYLDSWQADWEEKELRPVEKERDMLLVALEEAVEILDGANPRRVCIAEAVMKEAIAKAKGDE